jgi:hypothetical protein
MMRARYAILTVLFIVCFLTPVDAYTNQNLEWGVESGVKYHYSGHLIETKDVNYDGVIDEEIDLKTRYFGLIEEPYPLDVKENVTGWYDIWGFDVPSFKNGTAFPRFPFYVEPIGNWSLMNLLLPDIIRN